MYVEAQVTPGGRKEVVTKLSDNAYILVVREPAQHNAANKRALELIAAQFKVQKGMVRLIAGHRGRKKIFDVELETS